MRYRIKNSALLISHIFLFMVFYSHALAENYITVLERSVKPVAAVSSGRYIKTIWEVKLCNESDKIVACVVTIIFKDKNEDSLKKTSKEIEIKGHEENTYSDTVLLKSSIVNKIVSTDISIKVK